MKILKAISLYILGVWNIWSLAIIRAFLPLEVDCPCRSTVCKKDPLNIGLLHDTSAVVSLRPFSSIISRLKSLQGGKNASSTSSSVKATALDGPTDP